MLLVGGSSAWFIPASPTLSLAREIERHVVSDPLPFPVRLMVGQQTLTLLIVVRVHDREPRPYRLEA